MDRLLSGFGLFPRGTETAHIQESVTVPNIDILTRGDDMVIRADIPGVTPSDIEISVSQGMLTLSAKRETATESKEKDYVVRERTWGSYERTMMLPDGVKPDAIHADFVDGVLEISLPGAAHPSDREMVRIPVETPSGTASDTHH